MGAKEHLGLIGYDSFHFVVENVERSRAFYTQRLDFKEVREDNILLGKPVTFTKDNIDQFNF